MEVVGFIGGIIGISAALPQIFKCIKTGHTKDLSYATNAVSYVGSSIGVYYGVSIGHMAIVLCNAYALLINTLLLCTKLYFEVLCTGSSKGHTRLINDAEDGDPVL